MPRVSLLLVEALDVTLAQANLVDFAAKKVLLRVSSEVRATTVLSIRGLKGDARLLGVLATYPRLCALQITFGRDHKAAGFKGEAVDLSVVAPLLETLDVTIHVTKNRGKNKKGKKRGMFSMYVDEDEDEDEFLDFLADEEAGEAEEDDDPPTAKKPARKKSAAAGGEEEEDKKPAAGKKKRKGKGDKDAAAAASSSAPLAPALVQEPCTLLGGLRALRCLTVFRLDLVDGMGPETEAWMEAGLPPGLERLSINGRVIDGVGLAALARMVQRHALPRLQALVLSGNRPPGSATTIVALDGVMPPDEPGPRQFLTLLGSLNKAATPCLRELSFLGGLPLIHRQLIPASSLNLLLDGTNSTAGDNYDAERALVRGWWRDPKTRLPDLQRFAVDSNLDLVALKNVLNARRPELAGLGTLMYASSAMYMAPEDLGPTVVRDFVEELGDGQPTYTQAQAVRAISSYTRMGGPLTLVPLRTQASNLLFALIYKALDAPTAAVPAQQQQQQQQKQQEQRAMDFLIKQLLAMLVHSVDGPRKDVALLNIRDDRIEAAAMLACKVLAFGQRTDEPTRVDAAVVLVTILTQHVLGRQTWVGGSLGAIATQGLVATSASPPVAADAGAYANTLHMVRLLLRLALEWPALRTLAPQVLETLSIVLVQVLAEDIVGLSEALRAHHLLAQLAAVLLSLPRPYLLILSAWDTSGWLPGYLVDVLLRRIEAPAFTGWARHITLLLTTTLGGLRRYFPGMQPEEHQLGQERILNRLLSPRRIRSFWPLLAAEAKQVGAATLIMLLKEATARNLLTPKLLGAGDRALLAEAADVMKLATDGSPTSLEVLRALCGDPVSHLQDVLDRIQATSLKKTKSGKIQGLTNSLFEDFVVAMAGLTQDSTAGCDDELAEEVEAAVEKLGDELTFRLTHALEGTKMKRKLNLAGVVQGRQLWVIPRLRVYAVALAALTHFSDSFVTYLWKRRPEPPSPSSRGCVMSVQEDPPGNALLDVWMEALVGVDKLSVLGIGLARAWELQPHALMWRLLHRVADSTNVGRSAKGLVLLTQLDDPKNEDLDRATTKEGNRRALPVYTQNALSFTPIPVIPPEHIVCAMRCRCEKGHVKFKQDNRYPQVAMTLSTHPVMAGPLRDPDETLLMQMVVTYQRDRLRWNEAPAGGTFDRWAAELWTSPFSTTASQDWLMKHVTVPELIAWRAWRVLRLVVEVKPGKCLPHFVDMEEGGGMLPELAMVVAEALQYEAFVGLVVKNHLPQLLAFLERGSKSVSTSSLDLMHQIMGHKGGKDVPARLKEVIKKEAAAQGKGRGKGKKEEGPTTACLGHLVAQWSSDRRSYRGGNKELIDTFMALLPSVLEPSKAAVAREERSHKRAKR